VVEGQGKVANLKIHLERLTRFFMCRLNENSLSTENFARCNFYLCGTHITKDLLKTFNSSFQRLYFTIGIITE
jgi:hypothetical protein